MPKTLDIVIGGAHFCQHRGDTRSA